MLKRTFLGIAVLSVTTTLATYATATGAEKKLRAANQQPAVQKKETQQPGAMTMGDTCLMDLPGVKVSVTDVTDGVAIAFITADNDVLSVRRSVEQLAARHNRQLAKNGRILRKEHFIRDDALGHGNMMGQGMMGSGMMGQGKLGYGMMGSGMMGSGMMKSRMLSSDITLPASRATVVYIDGGAQLVFRAKDQRLVKTLRERAWMRAGWLASGECPMTSPARNGNPAAAKTSPAKPKASKQQTAG